MYIQYTQYEATLLGHDKGIRCVIIHTHSCLNGRLERIAADVDYAVQLNHRILKKNDYINVRQKR